jgi:hypothetical protein
MLEDGFRYSSRTAPCLSKTSYGHCAHDRALSAFVYDSMTTRAAEFELDRLQRPDHVPCHAAH